MKPHGYMVLALTWLRCPCEPPWLLWDEPTHPLCIGKHSSPVKLENELCFSAANLQPVTSWGTEWGCRFLSVMSWGSSLVIHPPILLDLTSSMLTFTCNSKPSFWPFSVKSFSYFQWAFTTFSSMFPESSSFIVFFHLQITPLFKRMHRVLASDSRAWGKGTL